MTVWMHSLFRKAEVSDPDEWLFDTPDEWRRDTPSEADRRMMNSASRDEQRLVQHYDGSGMSCN